jgi:D-inositol-3-phosphate glycosyltransferase
MQEQLLLDQVLGASRRLRILMVTPAGIGGTIQYSHNLANALADAGHELILATAIKNEIAAFPRRYRMLGVFDRFTLHLRPLRAFFRAVRKFDPDLVHFQGAQRPEFYLLLWAVLRGLTRARFVWTPQDVLSNSAKPYHRRLLHFIYGRMAHVILNARQNEGPVSSMFGVPSGRITVLPIPDLLAFARLDLGCTLPTELTLNTAQPMFLCFGLIEERKGIGTLIAAFAELLDKGQEATLLIMGKSLTEISPFRAAIRATGLGEKRIQLIDRYASFEEMNGLFGHAHAVVLPYHRGWNSGVLATAQGYGRPVVATTVGGFDEVVTDGETGLLVQPRDPKALAGALKRLLNDPELHDRLVSGSVAASARVSWPEIAAFTCTVYEQAAQPRKTAA